MPITVDDPRLKNSPNGRFLLAIAKAVEALAIDELDTIRVVDGWASVASNDPELMIVPTIEADIVSPLLGRFGLRYRARLVMVQQVDPLRLRGVGWWLESRHLLAKRFSGRGADGSALAYGEHSFCSLAVAPGPLLDDSSRQMGYLRSELEVSAEAYE